LGIFEEVGKKLKKMERSKVLLEEEPKKGGNVINSPGPKIVWLEGWEE